MFCPNCLQRLPADGFVLILYIPVDIFSVMSGHFLGLTSAKQKIVFGLRTRAGKIHSSIKNIHHMSRNFY